MRIDMDLKDDRRKIKTGLGIVVLGFILFCILTFPTNFYKINNLWKWMLFSLYVSLSIVFIGFYIAITGEKRPRRSGGVIWVVGTVLLLVMSWYYSNDQVMVNPILKLNKIPYFLPLAFFIFLGIVIHNLEKSMRTRITGR